MTTPIPPPFIVGPSSPVTTRVDTMPTTDFINNTMTTTNVNHNIDDNLDNLPQLLDSRGGSQASNVPKFDVTNFNSWKIRFLVHLEGLEPYLLDS